MDDHRTLVAVDSVSFDRALKLFVEFGVCERHFNGLQNRYRSLASTWLLATFAGVGFVISQEQLAIPVDRLLVITGVGVAASIGITLLWNIDILVYHRLLDACFIEGLRMEREYPWLPQIRTNMMFAHGGRGVLPRVALFYIFGNITVLLLSSISFTIWLWRYGIIVALVAIAAWMVAILALSYWMVRATGNTDRLEGQVRQAQQRALAPVRGAVE